MTPYLVVCDIVVHAHPLDLHRTKHPTDIVDDLNVSGRRLEQSQLSNDSYGFFHIDQPF
jgi:hypothetical protein